MGYRINTLLGLSQEESLGIPAPIFQKIGLNVIRTYDNGLTSHVAQIGMKEHDIPNALGITAEEFQDIPDEIRQKMVTHITKGKELSCEPAVMCP